MTLARLIPIQHRALAKEVVTFGTVGVINTVTGMIIFNIVLGLGAIEASTISTIIATFVSYVLNRHVTYRHRARTPLRRELPLFVGFNLIGLGLQLGVLALAKWAFELHNADRLGLNIARFGGVAVGTVFLLLTYRTFVFQKKPDIAEAAAEAAIGGPMIMPHPASALAETDLARLDAELVGSLSPAGPLSPASVSPSGDTEPAITGLL